MEEKQTEVYTNEDGVRVVPASALQIVTPHRRIVLADGTEIETGYCAVSEGDNSLWIWIEGSSGYTMGTLFPIFTDAQKTKKIEAWFIDADGPTVYEGYTELVNIHVEYGGTISINMRHQPNA